MSRRMTESDILLNKQCEYLQSLGFVVVHASGNRIHVCINTYHQTEVTVFADSKNIVLDVCSEFHKLGMLKGQNQFRTNLLSMLNEEVY
jgi:hypothetical protein